MSSPAVTPQQDWFSANAPQAPPAQTDWFVANAPPPAVQKPAVTMQEDPLGKVFDAKEQVGQRVAKAAWDTANDVYDVSAPGIAEQIYRHMKGMPNYLEQIPGKMVLAFLAAGGLGPEIEAASAKGHAQETIKGEPTAPKTSAPAPTAEAAKVAEKPLSPSKYRVYDQGTITENPKETEFFVGTEEKPVDLRTTEQKQKAVDDYFAKHPDERPQPQVWKRGPKKGQPKTYKVFDQGKWTEVPVYK